MGFALPYQLLSPLCRGWKTNICLVSDPKARHPGKRYSLLLAPRIPEDA